MTAIGDFLVHALFTETEIFGRHKSRHKNRIYTRNARQVGRSKTANPWGGVDVYDLEQSRNIWTKCTTRYHRPYDIQIQWWS